MKELGGSSFVEYLVQILTAPVEYAVRFFRSHSQRQAKEKSVIERNIASSSKQDLIRSVRKEYEKLTPAHRAMASSLSTNGRFVVGSPDVATSENDRKVDEVCP
jgi:hypothetical protein